MLDDIVKTMVAVDLIIVVGGASADLETGRVENGGRMAAFAGAAGEGVPHGTEVERLGTGILCEDVQDLHAGACVLVLLPGHPVVGLVVVLKLLPVGDLLGICNGAEGGET